jgi:TonB family protein
MRFQRPFSLVAVALLCGAAIFPVLGQTAGGGQTAAASGSTNASAAAGGAAAKANTTPPITEDVLRKRFQGKMVFLRGLYVADDLNFDMNGNVNGTPQTGSFTLSALQIRKVSLSKKKVEFEADRYALHFSGALPYESDSKSFDKVKISTKPIHIAIDRELVITPKAKKNKGKAKKDVAAAKGPASATATPATAPSTPAAAPAADALPPGTTTSAAHSAMLLNTALNKVFASDIDEQMMGRLPDYWQEYFKSKRDHHEFEPADPNVLQVGGDVTPPKVLNSIDPSSNQYAQKYGVAGMTLFRTVVDASGKPEQIAISRPIGFGLDEKAVEAIKASRFDPATKDGKPVPSVIDVVVTFRIYSNRTKPGSVTKGSKQTQVVASAWDAGTTDSSSSKPIQ